MSGLLLKDLYNIKKQSKFYILFIALYSFLAIANKDASIMGGIVCVFCAMLPITAMGYDERANWDKYALTMPVSRADMVGSKYLLGLLCSIAGGIITLILNVITGGLTQTSIILTMVFWGLAIIFISILLPIMIKFGVEKGRVIMFIVFFAPTLLLLLADQMRKAGFQITPPSQEMIDFVGRNAPFLIIIVVAIIFLISLSISLAIYKKKEL